MPEVSPDRLWSQRLIAGDESALREVYRDHAPAVLGLATRVLGSLEGQAEDVMQDVFVRLWEHPGQFDPARGHLRSYLLAMTHSRAVERVRAEDSQRRRLEAAGNQPVDPATDPSRGLTSLDSRSAVQRVLADLPPEQRIAIEMAYYRGLSYRDVAVALAEPEGTVRYRIRAGMQKMRAALQAEEVSP
ncbi:MAG: polymerase sigma-70 factor, subfamily [Actinomycetota bacterium]|nr:polymerase sigma-70 factor, subfamily [Actinomycetota bacterium]